MILDSARALFVQPGYEATTTRMIATSAGVTDAMIYRHFSSKRELLLALIDEMTTEFSAMTTSGLPGAFPPGAPSGALLAGLGARFAEVFDTHLDLLVLLLTHRDLLAHDQRFVVFVDRAAQHLGEAFDPTDPEHGYLLARGFMGAIASFGLLQRTLGLEAVHPLDVRDYVAALVPLFAGPPRDVAASGVGHLAAAQATPEQAPPDDASEVDGGRQGAVPVGGD